MSHEIQIFMLIQLVFRQQNLVTGPQVKGNNKCLGNKLGGVVWQDVGYIVIKPFPTENDLGEMTDHM